MRVFATVVVSISAAAVLAAEPFMQMRFDAAQTDADKWPSALESLRVNPGCADEVWFSTGCGYRPLEWHREQSARCAAAAEDVRRLGIVPSLQIQMTIGHGDMPGMTNAEFIVAKTWRGFTGSNGVECVSCSCPRDLAFLAYFEKVSEIYAQWKPYCVWIDDDLRMTNHKPVSRWITRATDPYGCWCKRCRGDYEKVKDRMSWREFSDRSLAEVAGRIAAVFHRLAPETRFGLQGCGDDARTVLAELERVSGHPVSYRSPGCYYYDWDDPRLKIRDALSTWSFVVNQGEEAYRRMDRICTEIETCPRLFSNRGATSLILQSMTTLALGMNSMSYYITSAKEDPSLCRERLYPALARTSGDMKAYAAANEGTVPCGFGLEENPTPWPWRLPFYGVPLVPGFSREIGKVVTLKTGGLPPDGAVMEREVALARGVTSAVEKVETPDGRRYVVLKEPFFGNSSVSIERFREVQGLFAWASHDRTPVVLETPVRVSVFPRTTPDGVLKTVLVQSAELDATPPLVLRLNEIASSVVAVRWHETGGESGTVRLDRRGDGAAEVTIPSVRPFGSIWMEVADSVPPANEVFVSCGTALARVVTYRMEDQTDGHDELVHRDECLLGFNEIATDVRAPVIAIEDVQTGRGTAVVRLAPLPHARSNPDAVDFTYWGRPELPGGRRGLVVHDTGYPFVRLDYEGGAVGRTKALQDWQRTVRPYVSGRDGVFLSNTWGDRNRDTRINESFLLGEVKAAAELGVEVVQVDDGRQSGRSANSAFANGKGVWNGYWAASPDFWVPDPKRFPNGLAAVTKAAAENGIRFGLWFGPDSSNDAANWERDADWLLKLHRECGVDYYKLDSMKTTGALSLARQKKLFDKVLRESEGKIVIDMDVTAEKRPGYFGMMSAGPLFLENRYSDYQTYWPHLTLRALWSLAEVIDPVRLRMEVLNPLRNREKYGDDPLAPAAYPAETLFAIVMPASPLGWFEIQNLAPETVAAWKPLVAAWKRERDAMAACNVIPVGTRPDGLSWTGFVFTPREKGKPGYGLFFRELAQEARYDFDFRKCLPDAAKVTVLSPRGKADFAGVEAPVRDFVWARFNCK